MTRPLLLLALAAVLGFLYGLWRASVEAPARWVESDDVLPPDPWTVALADAALDVVLQEGRHRLGPTFATVPARSLHALRDVLASDKA